MQQPWGTSDPVPSGAPAARAGFWTRFAAGLLDIIILNIADIFIRAGIGSVAGERVGLILGIAYPVVMIGMPRGQTLGGMALRIRVVSLRTGEPIGYARSVVRYAVSILSAIVIFLGYFWMIWDKEKQTWHDKAVGAVVIPVVASTGSSYNS